MSRTALLLAGALALGASAAAAQSVEPWRRVQLPGPARHVSLDTIGGGIVVPVSAATAWASLRQAYQRLGIRTELEDSAHGVIGNLRIVRSSDLGPIAMDQAFDCGSSPSGPLADRARLTIAVSTFVTASGTDSANVRTGLIATAESVDGPLRGVTWCTSKGSVEYWLVEQVAPRRRRR